MSATPASAGPPYTRPPYHQRFFKQFKAMLRRQPRFTFGQLDGPFLQHLLGKSDPVILEIGAHDGAHTLWFLKLFPRARLYCFEPDPRPRKRFQDRVNSPCVKLFDVAVSNRDGMIDFHLSGEYSSGATRDDLPVGSDYSSSIRAPKQHLDIHPLIKFPKSIQTPTLRLDTWRAREQVELIDFIWADVQGAEIDLIDGAAETLSQTRYLYTEYNNRELYEGQLNLPQILKRLPNFELLHRYENDILLRNKVLESPPMIASHFARL